MSQTYNNAQHVNRKHQEKDQSHAYGKVWLYFMYYWIIFGIGCYFGQYLPMEWRRPLSIALFVLILATLFIQRARKYGLIISHIYAILVGLLSYATFTTYMQNLGPEVFYKNVLLAIGAFIVFGILGYFIINDASSIGKYLFVALIALIIAGLIGMFINNPIYHTVITVVGLILFLLYTLYDFNRMKQGNFSPREMGFNLFINLLNIIKDVLRLANRFKN
ncbi:Bax inhibitor-1 family protein [Staphylococcus sp. GDX8P80P]|uniref:Bax inhibitor-1/YccA family protein n=1 Tax=Staphylococcus sp. GDX8P80P TaxID=2804104 RepID=UPI001AEBBC18|nr:Bax inhibitor-1 family protein [Staphylococcus sp. GDX8P80P]